MDGKLKTIDTRELAVTDTNIDNDMTVYFCIEPPSGLTDGKVPSEYIVGSALVPSEEVQFLYENPLNKPKPFTTVLMTADNKVIGTLTLLLKWHTDSVPEQSAGTDIIAPADQRQNLAQPTEEKSLPPPQSIS
jgi:hypothetical protein